MLFQKKRGEIGGKRRSSAGVPALCRTGTFWAAYFFFGIKKEKIYGTLKKRQEPFAFAKKARRDFATFFRTLRKTTRATYPSDKKREKAPSWYFSKTRAASFSVPREFFFGGKALKKRAAAFDARLK